MFSDSDPTVTRITVVLDKPILTEPPEPELSSYTAGANSLADLDKEDRDVYRWDYDRYQRKLSEYPKRSQALADFNLEISRIIAKKQLYLIQDCNTPYDRLIRLRKHVAPDASTRRHEIKSNYNALKTAPAAMSNLDDWFSS
ncbi:hypothetical protein K3495_g10585 [Podosphaera aphanis]|nr:hypothetical protein K3495_g10585 [Podosphaera aphanis]